MKIIFLDEVESMTNWLDENDVLRSVTHKFKKDETCDSDVHVFSKVEKDENGNVVAQHDMPQSALDKWMNRIVKIGHAEVVE